MTTQRAIRIVPARTCKNAGIDRRHLARPAPYPGPRCATCNREMKEIRRKVNRANRLAKGFGLTEPEYQAVKAHQGGGCICYPWTGYNGNSRPLSVDHDHETGLIRGVICKHCNDLLGRIKDDPQYFTRMVEYLLSPPAVQVLGPRYVPEG